MGCDIHLHIEVKMDGKWEHWSCPSIDRRYALFAKMADVRNEDGEITPISEPKGLPADITAITRLCYEYMKADAHSMSWLGMEDIIELERWCKNEYDRHQWISLEYNLLNCYCFGNSFVGTVQDKGVPEIQDVRFVFWFDN